MTTILAIACMLLAPPNLAAENQPGQEPATQEEKARPPSPRLRRPDTGRPQGPGQGIHEQVVVTASKSEEPLLDASALVTVFSTRDLRDTPSLTLDGLLQREPGFSLFRRSGSLTAHPTTQGVSLRGIGPSGTSRSLVLFDGVPLNDPFGGWVYWNRIPWLALERVEIARGALSSLYGSAAMGGTIQLLPRGAARGIEARARLGNASTWDVEALATEMRGRWRWLASARAFRTGGFFVAPEAQRGAVDEPAASQHQSFFGRVYYKNAHVGVNWYRERRRNGTALQRNNSRVALLEGGLRGERWRLDLHVQSSLLESSFSRILPDRSAEFPTARQEFSTTGVGGSFAWNPKGRLVAGADWRRASWNGNAQNLAGLFVQQVFAPHSRIDLLAGVRLDVWQNRSVQTTLNPRLGLLFRAGRRVALRASAYRGFRAPTLNELYRPFRVGNIVTDANPDLNEERLWGTEAGIDLFPAQELLVRFNGFWNSLRDPVSNVTVSTTPELILRRRENQGRATIRGIEAESIWRRGPWRLRAAYLYSEARFSESGLRLPQVPLHQGLLEAGFEGPVRWLADARWMSGQFDDDLNRFNLGGYAVFGASMRKSISERLELFAGVENLLNRQYPAAATPIERTGDPRLFHAGIRVLVPR